MPELPEVEVICNGLKPNLISRTITNITFSGKHLRSPIPTQEIITSLTNQKIMHIKRRAKYILISFDNNYTMALHLGMTGNLIICRQNMPTAKHDHACWHLDDNNELRFNDVRRFGSINLISPAEKTNLENTFFSTTGPEPFDSNCNADYYYKLSRNKKQSVKTFIMSNKIVAGVGNIYANETLFKAQIKPTTPANNLSRDDWHRVNNSLRSTLEHAISCGGSTISDYKNASGEQGYFQINFKVYGKAGDPCPRCQSQIKKGQISGRATFYCQNCQR